MASTPHTRTTRQFPRADGTTFPGEVRGTTGILITALCCLFSLCQPGPVHAQEPSSQETVYRVETTRGDVVIGTLVSETDETVVLNTRQLGEVTIQRSNIERMQEVDQERFQNGEYWFRNPQSTRYFFSPNAIGIPKGQGYYQNTWILFNNVNYGVSDNVSVGAGMVPIFLFGASALPIWVLPKLSVSPHQSNVHFAGGAVLGGVIGEDATGVGVLYGASTVGTRDDNVTLGVGFGYQGDEIADTPVISLSGMTRLSQTIYLISENYYVPATDGTGVVSMGARWAPENFALDFALFRPLEDTGAFIAFPWLGVTIPFGN